MPTEKEVHKMIEDAGGTVKEIGGPLPDGSGFAIASFPLPADHWLTQEGYNVPPMPFRMGNKETIFMEGPAKLSRQDMADRIRMAGKYAIRASTMNGKDMDFDPDAMLQNLVVGMLGYWTENGLSGESFDNPKERTQWCCDGDGQGSHDKRCRHNPNRDSSMQSSSCDL